MGQILIRIERGSTGRLPGDALRIAGWAALYLLGVAIGTGLPRPAAIGVAGSPAAGRPATPRVLSSPGVAGATPTVTPPPRPRPSAPGRASHRPRGLTTVDPSPTDPRKILAALYPGYRPVAAEDEAAWITIHGRSQDPGHEARARGVFEGREPHDWFLAGGPTTTIVDRVLECVLMPAADSDCAATVGDHVGIGEPRPRH